MSETKPRSEQVRFISDKTGEHDLDTYLEACERTGITLPDLIDVIFDSNGDVNPNFIEFRIAVPTPGVYNFQYRLGPNLDPEANWNNITDDVFDVILAAAAAAQASATASADSATASASSATSSAATATTKAAEAAASAVTATAFANGMRFRTARAASTGNLTLSAPQTVDGVSLIAGDRVLAKNQSTASQNGIYQVNAGAWTRTTDMDTWAEVPGTMAVILEGSTNADLPFLCTSNDGGTLGSTAINFINFPAFIVDGTITNAKLANMAANTIKGSVAGGVPADLTPSQARSAAGAAASGANSDITSMTALASLNGGQLAGFRNKLINGDFRIWQRNTSAALTSTADAFVADRWVHYFGGSGFTVTPSRQTHTLGQTDVPGNPKYFMRVTVTTAGSLSANRFAQRIEGVNTLAGGQFCFTIYMKASSAFTLNTTNSLIRQNFGTGGSPSANVDTLLSALTVNDTSITTSWKKITVTGTLPSISGKTIGTNGNDCLEVILDLPLTNAISIDFSSSQFESGLISTPFEDRGQQIELALCQRYCLVVEPNANSRPIASGVCTAVNAGQVFLPFPVEMRAAPTGMLVSNGTHFGVFSLGGGTVATTTVTLNATFVPSTKGAMIEFLTASGLTNGIGTIMFSNGASSKLTFTGAEL